jgi:hypothetical protein
MEDQDLLVRRFGLNGRDTLTYRELAIEVDETPHLVKKRITAAIDLFRAPEAGLVESS